MLRMSKKDKSLTPNDPSAPKVIVKKRGGCGTFFAGFMFSFVLLLVVFIGGGLYIYYNLNVRMVENLVGVTIPLEGNLKDMSVKQLLEKKDQLVNATIDTLKNDFGVEIPSVIPGTKISLTAVYDETITFRGSEVKVKDIRIQDIANTLDEFVQQVLPKMYKHVTVAEVLDTAQTTILQDLGYPALVDDFYNVGTEAEPVYKSLSNLTIEQALDIVPKYFSHDTLTVQGAIDALGIDLLPKPSEGEADVYADLRVLKISELNVESLSNQITGEVLKKLVDLSAYEFTNSAEFDATTVKELGNYLLTLSLGEFVALDGVVKQESTLQLPQFANLDSTIKLANLRDAIFALKLNQIFNVDDISQIETSYPNAGEMTVQQFLSGTQGTFAELTGLDSTSSIGYVKVILNSTESTWQQNIEQTSIFDLLGGADYVTPIAGLCDTTLQEITESDDAVSLLMENFGTLGDLVGSSSNTGIFQVISSVTITELLNNPADAITNKLKSATITLGELLGVDTPGASQINKDIMSIQVGELFTDANSAINKVLYGENNDKTLGAFLNITDASGVLSKLANLTMYSLMNGGAGSAIQGVIDGLTLSDVFGEYSDLTSEVLKDLYGYNAKGEEDPFKAGSTPIKDVFKNISKVRLLAVFGATTNNILNALYKIDSNMQVGEVFNQINNIKLSDFFGSNKPAIFNLVNNYSDLTLGNINEMKIDSANLTIGSLVDARIIKKEEIKKNGAPISDDDYDKIKGLNIMEIINKGILAFV